MKKRKPTAKSMPLVLEHLKCFPPQYTTESGRMSCDVCGHVIVIKQHVYVDHNGSERLSVDVCEAYEEFVRHRAAKHTTPKQQSLL